MSQFTELQAENEKEVCQVFRNGEAMELPVNELVVGDLMKVRVGDVLAADALLVSRGGAMKCSEANLTGESTAVLKNRKKPLVLKGTQVVEGQGDVLVIAVGSNSCNDILRNIFYNLTSGPIKRGGEYFFLYKIIFLHKEKRPPTPRNLTRCQVTISKVSL